MRKTLLIILTILTTVSFSGCTHFRDTFKYGNPAKDFMKDLMRKDYDKCISLMDNGTGAKPELDEIHNKLTASFGANPDFSYLTKAGQGSMDLNPVPNTTTILLQVSNDTNVGQIEAQFNDKTGKIIYVKPLPGATQPIPDMGNFWLFGMVTLCVLLFNIYMLRRVKRSDMVKKWLKYLAIILLNVPSLRYAQISGVGFSLWHIQLFFGVDFVPMGYANSLWVLGIPLGGIYVLWQLRTGKYIKAPKKPKAERIKEKLKA